MAQDSPKTTHCPGCGKALSGRLVEGLCPACLLAKGAQFETEDEADRSGGTPRFDPPTVEALARLFPQLRIEQLIGVGGMGAVYKAHQPTLDRWVALKILPAMARGSASFSERFQREARALARLNHPNIVSVHEFGQAGDFFYFLMEFVEGANLRQLIREHRLSPREALQIVPQICDALQYAHDEGVVHRDIKPENVLVDRKGRIKIADFGLAKIAGSDTGSPRLTLEGQVMGTPHYMAPEQVERPGGVDHRADIFALGVVFYELLTGDLPLGKFPPPSRKVQLDVRLDEIVLKALENDPDRRYQHASEVKDRIHSVVAAPYLTGTAAVESVSQAESRQERFLKWLGIGVVRERDGEREVVLNGALGVLFLCMAVSAVAHYLVRWLTGGEHAAERFVFLLGLWAMIAAIRDVMHQPAAGETQRRFLGPLRAGGTHATLGGVLLLVLVFGGTVCAHYGIVAWRGRATVASLPSTTANSRGPDTMAAGPTSNPLAGASLPGISDFELDPNQLPSKQALEQLPELEFVAWQSEWMSNGVAAARTRTGLPVTNAAALKQLRALTPLRMDLTAVSPGHTNPPLSHFWFSHPAFDRCSWVSLSPLDSEGNELSWGSGGSSTSGYVQESSGRQGRLWMLFTGNPKAADGTSPTGFRLRYALGRPEHTRTVEPGFSGGMTFEGNALLNSIGQSPRGESFLGITTTAAQLLQSQFLVTAVTKQGREYLPSGGSTTGSDPVRNLLFTFGLSLDQIDHFRVGLREVRTVEWREIFLGLSAGHASVRTDGSGTHTNLQAALDAVPSGGWIDVGPGEFRGNVAIRKRLRITGAGLDRTVLLPSDTDQPPTRAMLAALEKSMHDAPDSQARQTLKDAFERDALRPVLLVEAHGRSEVDSRVSLQDLRIRLPGIPENGFLSPKSAVRVRSGTLELERCAIVGSVGNGVLVHSGASTRIRDSLIAAAWNTGLSLESSAEALVTNSVIRNCYYAGIVAGEKSWLVVRHSWISGAAWHGIRYDNCNPTLIQNRIEGNARSGIYASGKTVGLVSENLISRNGMSGVSCWYESRGLIVSNVFLQHPREALAILGASQPRVERNAFLSNEIAVTQMRISSRQNLEPQPIQLLQNQFLGNGSNAVWGAASPRNPPPLVPDSDSARETQSLFNEFTDATRPSQWGIGVRSETLQRLRVDPQTYKFREAPFALTPEEIAIVPEGDLRDSTRWQRRSL